LKSSDGAQNGFKTGSIPQAYEFGRYRLEVPTRQLLRDGEAVALTPKAFDVLVALVERHDRVVDKGELMKVVWPDSFVEEANLSQTIFVLRKTLGDDDNGRPFIDTVPRRGYRFAAPVRAVADREPVATAGWTRRAGPLMAASLLIAAMAAAGVWRVSRRAATAAGPVSGKTRVVVLPFENLTRNPADDWLGAAFSDSITSALRDLDDLIVVSRDRVAELYRERSAKEASSPAATLRHVADTLGARYYVHGSFQRVDADVRVTARVVDTESGSIQAQQTVTDRDVNVLALEDNLARVLATDLRSKRTPAPRRETPSLEAYRLVSEAQQLYSSSEMVAATEKLKSAIRIDDRYAFAWALMAMAYARAVAPSAYSSGSYEEYRRQADGAARRAIELDSALYEGHVALALAARAAGKIGEWRAESERAMAINPRLAEAYEQLADSYNMTPSFGCGHDRDPTRAETLYRQSLEIDPRLAATYANLIYHEHFMLRFDEALRVAEAGLKVLPGNAAILRARSSVLMFTDRLEESERDIDTVSRGGKDLGVQDLWVLGSVDVKKGRRDRAAARFEEVKRRYPDTLWDLSDARVYLSVGDVADGVAALRAAIEADPLCARYVSETPAFAPYRTNPRVAALLTAGR